MYIFLKRTAIREIRHSIFYCGLSGIIRKLAITLPCLLICGTVAAGNERPKLLNDGGVSEQIVFDEILNRGTVMSSSVVLGEVDLSKIRSESGADIGTSRGVAALEVVAPSKIRGDAGDDESSDKSFDSQWSLLLGSVVVICMLFSGNAGPWGGMPNPWAKPNVKLTGRGSEI